MMIQEILRNIGKYIGVYIKKRIVINEHIYEHVRRLSLTYLSTHFRYFNCTLYFLNRNTIIFFDESDKYR